MQSNIIRIDWQDFKDAVDSKSLRMQCVTYNKHYMLVAFDGPQHLECSVDKMDQNDPDYGTDYPGSDTEDFEVNYLPNVNKSLKDRDDAGRDIIRTAATDKGWAFLANPIEFTTSKDNSVFAQDWKGNDRGQCVLRFYDSQSVEITDNVDNQDSNITYINKQDHIDTKCVKTALTIALGYDYDIISGKLEQHQQPIDDEGNLVDVRMYTLIGIFDQYGIPFDPDGPGTAWSEQVTEFVGGVNLKFFNNQQELVTDGRAGKKLFKVVNPAIPFDQNQVQMILKHPVGFKHELMVILEYFRQP